MRIYTMTATFGKLEHHTLTLEPGLNVIHAPNEWGKSTWCAFLINMLYGIDTKERSKQEALADKDRYAPWSGAAMSGRLELNWNGRDITIERSSNSRIPLGTFRAYETETGIDIPELTATNCGEMLLGVERAVFTRSAFLRLADMPVTQHDALRRRLNNLVTTGDESGDADKLGQTLKDLKNKCRSPKRTGLLPEAEAQRDQLREQLWDLQELTQQAQELERREETLAAELKALENHKIALEYQAAKKDAQQVLEAKQAAQTAKERVAALAEAVAALPNQNDAEAAFQTAKTLQAESNVLLQQQRDLPEKPAAPTVAGCYEGLSPADAVSTAQKDYDTCTALEAKRKKRNLGHRIYCITAALLCAALAAAWFVANIHVPVLYIAGGALIAGVGILILVVSALQTKRFRKEMAALYDRHPGQTPNTWVANAQRYADDAAAYEAQLSLYRQQTEHFTAQQEQLAEKLRQFAPESTLSQQHSYYEQVLRQWESLANARKDLEQAQHHADALEAMAKPAQPPKGPDSLTYSAQETEGLLTNTRIAHQQACQKLAQLRGQLEALGQPGAIKAKLDALNHRIARLENYHAAIELAQDALYKTTLSLQRRFSPRITKRAQALFARLTGNRYQRITMAEDLSLHTATEDEDTLKELRRRSDGTIDQLYLALRLAVAEELTPEAPLVLDDALVRFDDTRLASAVEILKELSATRQVILFTCQKREASLL